MTSVALELFDLVSKFYFYYDHVDSLHEFLATMQRHFETHIKELTLPPSHTKINTVNMFANELVRHLRLMKSESALVHYLGTMFCQRSATRLTSAQNNASPLVKCRGKRLGRDLKLCYSTTPRRAVLFTRLVQCVNTLKVHLISCSLLVAGLGMQFTSYSGYFIPFTHQSLC